jgi:hypothetical protein
VSGGKKPSSPAKSITSATESESEEESSDNEEEAHNSKKKDDDGEVHDDVSVESSESPEKTIAELCADGFDLRADERVPVCTDELKDPGSLLKALSVSDVTVCRVIKQRIEDLEDAKLKLEIVTKENTALKRKVSELEGQFEVLRMMKKSKKGEEMSPEQRQLISDVALRSGRLLSVKSSFQDGGVAVLE